MTPRSETRRSQSERSSAGRRLAECKRKRCAQVLESAAVRPLFALVVIALPVAAQEQDAGAAMAVEAFAPIEAFEAPDAGAVEPFEAPAPAGLTARVFGAVSGLASVDTQFDSPPKVDLA